MSHSLVVLLAIVSLFLALGIYMSILQTVFAFNNIQIQWPITANETSNKSATQTSVIEGN
jgi:hypothetical protein